MTATDPKVKQQFRELVAGIREFDANQATKREIEIAKIMRKGTGVVEDAKFKAEQDKEKEGASQTVSTPQPTLKDEKISIGDAGSTAQTNLAQSQASLDETLTTTPVGAGTGGLPPEKTRSTSTSTRPLGGILGLLGGTKSGPTSTRISNNPQYEQAIQNAGLANANLLHSAQKGQTSIKDLAAGIQANTGPFPGPHKDRVNRITQQNLQQLKINEAEVINNSATKMATRMAEQGVVDVRTAHRIVNPVDEDDLERGLNDYKKQLKNLPENVQAQHMRDLDEERAELLLDTAKINLQTSKVARDSALLNADRFGIFASVGATTSFKDEQLANQKEDIFRNADGTLQKFDPNQLETYRKLANADLAKWQTIDMFTGEEEGFFRGLAPGKVKGKIVGFDPQEAYTHFLALNDVGADSNGRLTNDPTKVNFTRTAEAKQAAFDYFRTHNGERSFDVSLPGEGETESSLRPRGDGEYTSVLAKWQVIAETSFQKGLDRGATIFNPSTQVAKEGAVQVHVAGKAPPSKPVPAPFTERFNAAITSGKKQRFMEQLQTLQTAREKKLENLRSLNFPPVTLGE